MNTGGQILEHERGWLYLVLSVDGDIVVSVALEEGVFRRGIVFKHSTKGHIMKSSRPL